MNLLLNKIQCTNVQCILSSGSKPSNSSYSLRLVTLKAVNIHKSKISINMKFAKLHMFCKFYIFQGKTTPKLKSHHMGLGIRAKNEENVYSQPQSVRSTGDWHRKWPSLSPKNLVLIWLAWSIDLFQPVTYSQDHKVETILEAGINN